MKYIKYFLSVGLLFGVGFAGAQMMGPDYGNQMMGPQMMGPQMGQEMMGPQMMGPDYGNQMMGPQMMGPQMGQDMMGPQMMGPQMGQDMMGPQMMDQGYNREDQMRRGPPMPPINDIKRGIQMLEKTLLKAFDRLRKQVETKYKTQLPVECIEAHTQVQLIINSVKPALESYKSTSRIDEGNGFEMEDAMMEALTQMSDLDEYIPTIENCMQTAQFIRRAPQIFKKADREIKRLRKEIERLKKAAQKSNMFLPQISESDQSISELEVLLQTIKEEFKINPEEMERLHEEIFPMFGENWDNLDMARRVLNGVKKIKPFLRMSARDVKNINKQIVKLQKNNFDVSEAQVLLNQLKSQFLSIQEMINTKDYEDIDEEIMTYYEIKNEIEDLLMELRGDEKEKFVPRGFENFYNKSIEMPDTFRSFMKSNRSGDTNPVGESNPQPLPGPKMPSNEEMIEREQGSGIMPNFIENFLEKLTPSQKDSLLGNILRLFGR